MISIAKKQVIQAQAQLSEIKNQYRYLNIKAPNNGVVVAKNIKVGDGNARNACNSTFRFNKSENFC